MSIKQNGGVFGRNPTFNKVNATQVNTDTLDVTNDAVSGATKDYLEVSNLSTGNSDLFFTFSYRTA